MTTVGASVDPYVRFTPRAEPRLGFLDERRAHARAAARDQAAARRPVSGVKPGASMSPTKNVGGPTMNVTPLALDDVERALGIPARP